MLMLPKNFVDRRRLSQRTQARFLFAPIVGAGQRPHFPIQIVFENFRKPCRTSFGRRNHPQMRTLPWQQRIDKTVGIDHRRRLVKQRGKHRPGMKINELHAKVRNVLLFVASSAVSWGRNAQFPKQFLESFNWTSTISSVKHLKADKASVLEGGI